MKKYITGIIIALLISCNTQEIIDKVTDITPPKLLNIKSISSTSIFIESNEKIALNTNDFVSNDGFSIKKVLKGENSLTIEFNETMEVGKEYTSEFKITDTNNNYLSFIVNYYGFNENVPNILINEFVNKGSDSNPDKIELYILENGNMGGITIYSGVRNNFDTKYIFPNIEVNKGDYIVVRSTSKKYLLEYTETDNLDIDYDKKFVSGVRDIRTDSLKLSSTNGVISIYTNPYGDIIDSVIYTKNLNDPDKRYRNFGLRKVLERVDYISEKNQWLAISDIIYPEDVINIDNSTTTRSVNRINFVDTNTSEDWIICNTNESTFGFENSNNSY